MTVGCFGAVVSVGSNLIYALGRSEFIFRAGLLGALLSLASGLTIIQHFGLMGAALSRGAIQLLMIAIGFYYIAVRLNCPVPAAGLIRLLLSSICCAVTAHAILHFLEGTPGMLVAIPTGAIVYFAAVWSLRALPKPDTARLLNWANDMRGWVGNFRLRSR